MDRYVFADEAGNFDFSIKDGASRYFILTTVTFDDCGIGNELLSLRRDLAWRGINLDRGFHASTEKQAVRDEVFQLLAQHDFRVDATILEKRKAQPHLHAEERFYQMAWWLHFKYVAPRIASPGDRLLLVAASVGEKKQRRAAFHKAIGRVVEQVSPTLTYQVAFGRTRATLPSGRGLLQLGDTTKMGAPSKWALTPPDR